MTESELPQRRAKGWPERDNLPSDSVFRTLLDRGEEAIVPGIWWQGGWSGLCLGDCYNRAFIWMRWHYEKFAVRQGAPADIEGARMVLGTVWSPQEGRMGHGWVELPGDVVFDGVVQGFYRLSATTRSCSRSEKPRSRGKKRLCTGRTTRTLRTGLAT
jgi:hypothetical protein